MHRPAKTHRFVPGNVSYHLMPDELIHYSFISWPAKYAHCPASRTPTVRPHHTKWIYVGGRNVPDFLASRVRKSTSIAFFNSFAAAASVMDTFFISHGSPTLSIDESQPARHFLQAWKEKVLPEKPNAIIVISGHWETAYPRVNAVKQHDTIHDFYGFPKRMYQLKYPAPGSSHLAKRVNELLNGAGFHHVKEDKTRGLDHGAWVPLMLMYPEADIPVCQLSVQTELDGTHHYNMGKALAPLRDEGVLIFGSGSATHNLASRGPSDGQVAPWALEFDTWIKDALLSGSGVDTTGASSADQHNCSPCDVRTILGNSKCHLLFVNGSADSQNVQIGVVCSNHFYPLHVALGAAGEGAKAELIHHNWEFGTLSYASYRFSNAK
ncbi:hypothetical protein ACLOJK_017013 [Asimina triloba]